MSKVKTLSINVPAANEEVIVSDNMGQGYLCRAEGQFNYQPYNPKALCLPYKNGAPQTATCEQVLSQGKDITDIDVNYKWTCDSIETANCRDANDPTEKWNTLFVAVQYMDSNMELYCAREITHFRGLCGVCPDSEKDG